MSSDQSSVEEDAETVASSLIARRHPKEWSANLRALGEARGGLPADCVADLLLALVASGQEVPELDGSGPTDGKKVKKRRKVGAGFWLKPLYLRRLLLAMVPKEAVDGATVARFSLWLLGNRSVLSESGSLNVGLRWLNCVLHHGLCSPVDPVVAIYELFFQAMETAKSEIPIICDILFKTTGVNRRLVTAWRVRTLLKLSQKVGSLYGLDDLLSKYQQLDPALAPKGLMQKRATRASAVNTAFEKSFNQVRAHSSSGDVDLSGCDDILPPELAERLGRMDHTAFGKIRLNLKEYCDKRKASSAARNLLPPLEVIDFSDEAHFRYLSSSIKSRLSERATEATEAEDAHKLHKRKWRRLELTDCKTLGDIFANLHYLAPPSQIMSLLSSPDMFCILILNPRSAEVQERLSLTLYHILHNEFFAISGSAGGHERKRDLLQRVVYLHEWLQDSLPVVGRFLAEYLSSKFWNGTDFFLEIMKLLSYLPITSISELNDCFLTPLRAFYDRKYSNIERLLVLIYLHRLIMHWTAVEFRRFSPESPLENVLDDSSFMGSQQSKRAKVDKGDSRKALTKEPTTKLLSLKPGRSNFENLTPLKAVADLTEEFGNFVTRGVMELSYFGRLSNVDSADIKEDSVLFITEVFSMYSTLCRYVVDNEVPIFPRIPNCVIYSCLFSDNSLFLSRALEYLTMAKQEILLTCKTAAEQFKNVGDKASAAVALDQASSVAALNGVTLDILVILFDQNLYLARGESILRKHWEIEEEVIREELGLHSHPALLPYAVSYRQHLASAKNSRQTKDRERVRGYFQILQQKVPHVLEFLDTFSKSYDTHSYRSSAAKASSRISSLAANSESTSGVSSFKPALEKRKKRAHNNSSAVTAARIAN